jgi:hypothetical protein
MAGEASGVAGEVGGGSWRGRLAGEVGGGSWRGRLAGDWRGSLAGELAGDWRGRIQRTNSSKSSLVFRLLLSLPQVDTAEPVHDVHRTVPSRLCPVKSPFSKIPDDHVADHTNIKSKLRNILKMPGNLLLKL